MASHLLGHTAALLLFFPLPVYGIVTQEYPLHPYTVRPLNATFFHARLLPFSLLFRKEHSPGKKFTAQNLFVLWVVLHKMLCYDAHCTLSAANQFFL